MHRYIKTVYFVLAFLMGLFSGRQLAMGIGIAHAGEASNLAWVWEVHDANSKFKNYDFHTESASSTNVDWPVTFIFYNNAKIDLVKNGPLAGITKIGSAQHEYVYDHLNKDESNNYYMWDVDHGLKNADCAQSPSVTLDYHMRVYADNGDDRMYDTYLHYYVIGTTHEDRNECLNTAKFGWSEDAAAWFENYINGRYYVYPNSFNCFNFESYHQDRLEKNHYDQSDGYCTEVYIP